MATGYLRVPNTYLSLPCFGELAIVTLLPGYCIHSCDNKARLKIIDRINKTPEPAEVLTVKVYHKPRQMNNIRIIHFSFQSPGCRDISLWQKNVMKLICQLSDVIRAELRYEPDHEPAIYIPQAVIAAIEMINLPHRSIYGTDPFEEGKVTRADIVPGQKLFIEELD